MAANSKIPKAYPEDFLTCRAMGHAWDVLRLFKLARSSYRVRLSRCMRCEKGKRDLIDSDDHVEARSYMDPVGYSLPREVSFPTRGPWIAEQFRRHRVEVVVIKSLAEATVD